MRLKKTQKTELLKWIAEGLESGEINKRASKYDPPFEVSRAHIQYYRRTRKLDIEEIIKRSEHKALNSGLALKSTRVERLKKIAEMLEEDLFENDLLWTDQVKGVGAGPAAEVVEYEEFNKPEIDALRGIYDDIAKEVGGRIRVQEISGKDGRALKVEVEYVNSPITTPNLSPSTDRD